MENRNIEFIPKCLAVGFKRKCYSVKFISGDDLFQRFIDINSYCYWNINLKEIFDKCVLVGHIRPYCLLISAPDLFIQSLKLAHQKRLLKSPESFVIYFLGDVDSVNCNSVIPSQFVSLDEALCYVIFDLNINNESSTFDIICCRLAEWYPDMELPPQFLILATLRNLMDADQIYYTGYGYNIMTADKICISQWLGEQGPEDNVPAAVNSLSNLSIVDRPEMETRSKSDRVNIKNSSLLMDNVPRIRTSQSSMTLMASQNESVKRTKARSAVKEFFAKFRPRHHKSNLSSIATTLQNAESIDTYDRNIYPFSKNQPKFYSSNMEFCPRNSITYRPPSVTVHDNTFKPPWSWRTSLQSLPAGSTEGTLRRSLSSNSRLSTQAIHDESPPQKPITKSEKLKSRNSRSKSKQQQSSSSSKIDETGPGDNDTVQEDSGVHSVSESHSKSPSNGTGKYQSCADQHKSLDLGPDDNGHVVTPPSIRHKTKYHQRLSRSISTRLSTLTATNSLHPVIESTRWDRHDDKHVVFKDNSVIGS